MIIQINDKYRIERLDDLNYCIQQVAFAKKDGKTYKKGEAYWTNKSYHPTVGAACKYFATVTAQDDPEAPTLAEYGELLEARADHLRDRVNEMLEAAGVNYR